MARHDAAQTPRCGNGGNCVAGTPMAGAAGVGAMRDPLFLLRLYRRMVTIRRNDETLVRLLPEWVTYRLHGHDEGDPGRFRNAEEVSRWRERDPIPPFAAHLLELGLLTEPCRGDRATSRLGFFEGHPDGSIGDRADVERVAGFGGDGAGSRKRAPVQQM